MNKTAATYFAVCLLAFAPLGVLAQAGPVGGSPERTQSRSEVVWGGAQSQLDALRAGQLVLPVQMRAPARPRFLAQGGGVVEVDTNALYNRHIRDISLSYASGGDTVRVSGQFNRDKETAYLVLYVPGKWRMYLNLFGLLANDVEVQGQTVSLEFSMQGKMSSRVRVRPAGFTVTLGEIFRQVMRTGHPVAIAGRQYKLFYAQEIQGRVSGTPTDQKNFILIRPHPSDPTEYLVTMIPAEDVPSDRVRQFSVEGDSVGFKHAAGKLELHLP